MRQHLQLRHLILAAACLVSSTALADEKPRILVLPYRVDARIPVDSATCNTILAARMGKLDVFRIITQDELAQMASYQAMLQSLGADDDVNALKALGEAANADRLVSGVIGDVGGTATATLTLLDVKTGEIEKRIAGTAKGARDLILPLINGQADAMLAHLLRTYAPERTKAKAPAPTTAAAEKPSMKTRLGMIAGASMIAVTSGALGFAVAAAMGAVLTGLMPQLPDGTWPLVPAVLLGATVSGLAVTGVGVVALVVLTLVLRM